MNNSSGLTPGQRLFIDYAPLVAFFAVNFLVPASWSMRLVAANLDLIDDKVRSDPEAIHIFMDLLLKHGNPERGLRRMNELGVLAAFIPEFEPVVAMMQFNMYHHYTVDEHLLRALDTLARIGWSAGVAGGGERGGAPTATDRCPDRGALRPADRTA